MRTIDIGDIDDMALGATLLGTGGGGDPYIAKLMVKQAIEKYGPIAVVDPLELPQDGLVLTSAAIAVPAGKGNQCISETTTDRKSVA